MNVKDCQNCTSQTAGYKDCEDMSVKTREHDKNDDRVCCSEPQFDIILYTA